MKTSFLSLTIFIIAGIGLITVSGLVIGQIVFGNVCPDLFSIPACYVVLFLISLLIFSILKNNNFLYFFSGIAGLLIAVYFSFLQINEVSECPKCFIGIPLCYLSLFMFGILLTLRIVKIKSDANRERKS